MKVLVVGSEGNMGKRYCSILAHLGITTLKHDTKRLYPLAPLAKAADKIIVATPTRTHIDVLMQLRESTDVDILCEKPIARKSLKMWQFKNVYMVNNYAHLHMPLHYLNRTRFDYYNSGNDGRLWDCIQLIALAKGRYNVEGYGPIWTCEINGNWIERKAIDYSYVGMITDFLKDKECVWDWEYTQQIHEKVLDETEKRNEDFPSRNPSKDPVNQATW